MLRFARSIPALSVLCLGALAARASAQISSTCGPELAPLGCSFYFNLSNDGPDEVVYDPCGIGVFEAAGALVFTPPCGGPVLMPVGSVNHWSWPQTDMSAQPVAAGLYNLHYLDGTGLPGISIRVDAAQAAIAPLGSYKTGTTHAYRLCAPLDGGFAN